MRKSGYSLAWTDRLWKHALASSKRNLLLAFLSPAAVHGTHICPYSAFFRVRSALRQAFRGRQYTAPRRHVHERQNEKTRLAAGPRKESSCAQLKILHATEKQHLLAKVENTTNDNKQGQHRTKIASWSSYAYMREHACPQPLLYYTQHYTHACPDLYRT